MENQEYIERLIKVEQSDKSAHHRIDKIETDIVEIKELTIAVKEIAMEMKAMREDVNDVNTRLKCVEEKPLKDYEETKKQIKGKVISFVTGMILSSLAIALGLKMFI